MRVVGSGSGCGRDGEVRGLGGGAICECSKMDKRSREFCAGGAETGGVGLVSQSSTGSAGF